MSADFYETWEDAGLHDVAPLEDVLERRHWRTVRRIRAWCAVLLTVVACLLMAEQARADDFWTLDCYYNTATGTTAQGARDSCLPVWQQARGGQSNLGPAQVASDGASATVLFIDLDGGSETRTAHCAGTCAAPGSTPAAGGSTAPAVVDVTTDVGVVPLNHMLVLVLYGIAFVGGFIAGRSR